MSLFATPFVGSGADIALHVVAAVVMFGSVGFSLWVFWKVHELPIHKAKKSNRFHQIELVTVLTWIGFFAHWVWVVAVMIAFVDFEKLVKGVFHFKRDIENLKEEDLKEKEDDSVKGGDNA